jgi:antitoxin PrlF
MPSAMVTFNGRVTIPFNVRKQLGLKIGDNVDFVEIEKGRFAIIPGSESVMDLEDTDKNPFCADSANGLAAAAQPA